MQLYDFQETDDNKISETNYQKSSIDKFIQQLSEKRDELDDDFEVDFEDLKNIKFII